MHSRTMITLGLALALGCFATAQKPIPNVLSGDNLTAGMVRTGFKFGPAPVGGRNGSIAQNRPGSTHEKLQFARGKIPNVAGGGPELSEILGFPHEHVQDIEPIGDWSKGHAYFAVTHSQDDSGHFFILKTSQVAKAPNEHEVFNDPARVDGEGVHYEKYHRFNGAGQFNHPGDISAVGNILVIAAQNWPGNPPFANLGIGPHAAPDAVLFYDVANPEKPVYIGKLEIRRLDPALADLSNLWAGKVGDYYYMALGDGSRTTYFYSSEMSADLTKWKRASAAGVGFRGDTILAYRAEGQSKPVYLSIAPAVDDYQVVSVENANAGAQLNFVGAVSTYDIEDSAFAARGSGSGAYVSKRGRMTQVSIDRGFSGLLIDVESYSVHFGDRTVELPPSSPLLPLSDQNSWQKSPSYYETIQTADLDGDGKSEILARGATGMIAWKSDGTQLPGGLPFTDASGFAHPSVYKTIQTADVDGDGRADVLVRTSFGLVAFSFTGSAWKQLPGSIAFTNSAGFTRPEYYETIQTADLNGDGRDEVVARTAFGLFAWSFNGQAWAQLPGSAPLSDAFGFNRPQYYYTIQSADLDGDGRAEMIGRSVFGLYIYRHNGSAWVGMPGTIALSDALGYDKPEYYGTLQAADLTGDGREEVLIRSAAGLDAYIYTAQGTFRKHSSIPLLSDQNGFKSPGNWITIQCADLNGDGRCEVLARYFWGLTASVYSQQAWQSTRVLQYVGDYNRYDTHAYASTMQTGDLDGDGRADFLARLVTGLYAWSPDDLGFGRALPIGVKRVGAATACGAPAPSLNVNARPLSTDKSFRLIAENAPASTVGIQMFSGGGFAQGLEILGARVHVNLIHPAFFTLVAVADAQGRFDLPLPLAGAKGVRFYTQSLWVNTQPCSGRFFSATGALEVTVQ